MLAKEPELRAIAAALVDEFIETGAGDLAQQLTIPFPARVAIPLLGPPLEDAGKLVGWAQPVLSASGDGTVGMERAVCFNELYERMQSEPRDDIPTEVTRIQIDGRPVNNVEFIATMSTLFVAGLDTTANASAYAFELIARRDDIRELLLSDMSRIPQAVEE